MPRIFTICLIYRHSKIPSTTALIKIPVEKFEAGRTEIRLLEVRIFNPGRGIHDTPSIPTVGETQAVS
jgi:hypothetical protein